MVNSKNVAFKVDKQTPAQCQPPQPVGTIINCRKPTGKRASRESPAEVRTQTVPLSKFSTFSSREGKRKRGVNDEKAYDSSSHFRQLKNIRSNSPTLDALPHLRSQIWQQTVLSTPLKKQYKPTKLRANRPLHRDIDLDCWYTILTFSEPSQLLQMREKIPSCFRFLRDSPALWKHSRNSIYGDDLPDPPPGLTEFQYAHLRHGHGCMSCGAPATRKTYWAFLRRWCKPCFHSKTVKEQDAMSHFVDADGGDISPVRACLPAGMVDSWGNFVGVGPASNHSLKTIYLLSDVQKLVQEYRDQATANRATWHAEVRPWTHEKLKYVKARTEFAQKMERWEEQHRNERSFDYQGKKEARKAYFTSKAQQQFDPPMTLNEMSKYASYNRAIAIPKQPNMASWLQLKPKLEKERAEAQAGERIFEMDLMNEMTPSLEGTPGVP